MSMLRQGGLAVLDNSKYRPVLVNEVGLSGNLDTADGVHKSGGSSRGRRLRQLVRSVALLPLLPQFRPEQTGVGLSAAADSHTPVKPAHKSPRYRRTPQSSDAERAPAGRMGGSKKWTPIGCDDSKENRSVGTSCVDINYRIVNAILDYMLDNQDIQTTKGLFRISGNAVRVQDLWHKLSTRLDSDHSLCCYDTFATNSIQVDATPLCVTQLLQSFSAHDLTSLLMRSIAIYSNSTSCTSSTPDHKTTPRLFNCQSGGPNSTTYSVNICGPYKRKLRPANNGLIPQQATDLMRLATKLQDSIQPNDQLNWVTALCRARQLFTYRVVLCLLPEPERQLLLKLVKLLNQVTIAKPDNGNASTGSQMTANSLARCTVNTLFGASFGGRIGDGKAIHTRRRHASTDRSGLSAGEEAGIDGQYHGSCNGQNEELRLNINTLANLIDAANELDSLPTVLVQAVRLQLRQMHGWSSLAEMGDDPVDPICQEYAHDLIPPYTSFIMRQYDPSSLLPKPQSPTEESAVKSPDRPADVLPSACTIPMPTMGVLRSMSATHCTLSTSPLGGGGISSNSIGPALFNNWQRKRYAGLREPALTEDSISGVKQAATKTSSHDRLEGLIH